MIPNVTVPEGTRGDWTVERFEIPDNVFRLHYRERAPLPGTYTRLKHAKQGLVMSDTSAEKRDHMAFVRHAHAHCLMNGLGLGMCLGAILLKENVTKVTVVEIDKDLIDLVGPHYDDPRVEIVHADAFTYKSGRDLVYGAVWHDIWPDLCLDNLPQMHTLTRRYARRAAWQGSWGREWLERQRERERMREW